MIIHACTLSLESRSRGIAVSLKPACTTQWVPDYPARLCPTHNMTNKAGQTKPDYTVLSSTFSAWHPLWLPCLLGKCHSLWTIWSLGIRHIPAHSTHFLGLYDRGLTNSFGDHPQWEGGGITWSCYGSQSHLFRRANTHQWRELMPLTGKGVQPRSVSGHTLTPCGYSHPLQLLSKALLISYVTCSAAERLCLFLYWLKTPFSPFSL